MRIVFWENIISQHKVPYWNYLSESEKVIEFILIVEQVLSPELVDQGWSHEFKNTSKFKLVVGPKLDEIKEILKIETSNSYHIFSGIRSCPMVFDAFKFSLSYPIKRILLTERINLYGIRRITRRLASFFIERKYGKNYHLVLGSGSQTKEWYIECGIKPKNFFPFMYSVSYPKKIKKNKNKKKTLRFVFVGRLIKLKGLDILLRALNDIKDLSWSLDIYGHGNMKNIYIDQIRKLGMRKKVSFKGVLPNKELIEELHKYDTLILPSHRDGWGAVVNESISSGVRVICSDRCGASILLFDSKIGSVFNINKTKELSYHLKESIYTYNNYDPQILLEYSKYLTGDYVGNYLIEILEYHFKKIGDYPVPPWERFFIK